MQSLSRLKNEITRWRTLQVNINDLIEFATLDSQSLEHELAAEIERLRAILRSLALEALMIGPYDHEDAILIISARVRDDEAQEWALMLLEMYRRWAERHNLKIEFLDYAHTPDYPVPVMTFSVRGDYAFGALQFEYGKHRLVKSNRTNEAGPHEILFANVEVIPDCANDIVLNTNDLEINLYRNYRLGSWNDARLYVNPVRIVHKLTGLSVFCENKRGHRQNTKRALEILKARLFDRERIKTETELITSRSQYFALDTNQPIRSYILDSQALVRDHRTQYESSETGAILRGHIDGLILAALRWRNNLVNGDARLT